jgi:hypothetical protein
MTSSPYRLAGLAVALPLVLASCDAFTRTCDLRFVYGLALHVRDSVTGAPAANGATGVVRDGDFEEALETSGFDDLTMLGAGEREGVYFIQVTKTGYNMWTRSGVRVTDDGCHPVTVEVDVRLQPLPPG